MLSEGHWESVLLWARSNVCAFPWHQCYRLHLWLRTNMEQASFASRFLFNRTCLINSTTGNTRQSLWSDLGIMDPIFFFLRLYIYSYIHVFISLFIFGHAFGIQKFSGQGSNLSHRSNNARFLTAKPSGSYRTLFIERAKSSSNGNQEIKIFLFLTCLLLFAEVTLWTIKLFPHGWDKVTRGTRASRIETAWWVPQVGIFSTKVIIPYQVLFYWLIKSLGGWFQTYCSWINLSCVLCCL